MYSDKVKKKIDATLIFNLKKKKNLKTKIMYKFINGTDGGDDFFLQINKAPVTGDICFCYIQYDTILCWLLPARTSKKQTWNKYIHKNFWGEKEILKRRGALNIIRLAKATVR